jgi:hypothetical protein
MIEPAGHVPAGLDPMCPTALEYAARGWPVLPVAARGKVPLTEHGLKDATVDIEIITRWWARWPDANVGIATGAPGPTVIDCDGPIGKHAWSRFVAGVGWASSPWACTGGGGWHVYYAGDALTSNRAGWLRKVDVRGVGGYVVAPPSVHQSGARYWWVAGPDERDLAPIPDRVRVALTARPAPVPVPTSRGARPGAGYARAALDGELDKVRGAPVGTRNHTLCSAAFSLGQLVAAGTLERDLVVRSLFDAACSAGLNETETLRTIASGMRGGIGNPRRR